MRVVFLGHVSKDVNITNGEEKIVPGGGVIYGGATVVGLGEEAEVYTKCAKEDMEIFTSIAPKVKFHFLPSSTSTSIENLYPSSNPDDRISRMISRADPFTVRDLMFINETGIIHINPLWYGEFPDELIEKARKKATFLAGDAQGFLRQVDEDGKMVYRDWKKKEEYLCFFDLFKVDSNEARIMTGSDEPKEATKRIVEMGVKMVLMTHKNGVCVYDGKDFYEAEFGEWKLEGRTGRGDTCTAAFLVAMHRFSLPQAVKFAAEVTTRKMQYPGPYRG